MDWLEFEGFAYVIFTEKIIENNSNSIGNFSRLNFIKIIPFLRVNYNHNKFPKIKIPIIINNKEVIRNVYIQNFNAVFHEIGTFPVNFPV